MGTTLRVPRSTGSGQPTANPLVKRYSMADITSLGSDLPNRYGLHAVQGWGKTSLVSHAPNPIFIQTRLETGLEALIKAGQIKETAHLPECQDWLDLRAQVRFLVEEEHSFRTLAIDTVNGAERLMHEFVCARDYASDWGDKGFGGYKRGFETSLAEWRLFLKDLDDLRRTKRMMIFMLAHAKVKTFKNPGGNDFDHYYPDMHELTWGLTHGWLDAVFFGNYEVVVQSARGSDLTKKGKGVGGKVRMLYTQNDAAYEAKNRLGLPEEIDMGSSSAEGWTNLTTAIKTSAQTRQEEPVNA